VFGQVERLPGSPQLHRWADWAELLCFIDGQLSVPDLGSGIESRADVLSIETNDDCEPDARKSDPLEDLLPTVDQFKDAVSGRSKDVFNYLLARADAFGEAYPFEVNEAGRMLRPREPRPDRLIYLFMLAGSLLRYIPSKRNQQSIASQFEWLSLHALKAELPTRAEVRLFGANGTTPGPYTGTLTQKIGQLAIDLREKVLIELESDFDPGDRGDNGLDLVGWVPPHDAASGMLTAFGQCACTPAWVQKQHSSSVDAWEPIFRFTVDPVNYCFIPFDFRRPDGSWYARHSIHNTVVMDRRRILAALGKAESDGSYKGIDYVFEVVDLDLIRRAFWESDQTLLR